MGLGGGPTEWDDYEWFDLADVPLPTVEPLVESMRAWLRGHRLWVPDGGSRVLLADLDNLRADPVRLRARVTLVVELARQADVVALAGQEGAVARALPWLEEFTRSARAVGNGSDLADWVLLDAADAVTDDPVQFLVVSNDGIFARLARRGPLTLLSPGADALSERLRTAARRVVDLAALEQQVAAG